VTERAAYIGRVRELAKACATAYLVAEGELDPTAVAGEGA